jgi:predicted aspartyl protease
MHGVKHDPPGVEFEAIIDTGFTGFIQLPLPKALSLSLPLEGTNSVILADESSLVMLTALAQATLLDRTEVGVVLLSMSSTDILVGMDFLRRFERTLIISNKIGVALLEEENDS